MSDAGASTEILNGFLAESFEGLDQLDRDLKQLAARGAHTELIGRVFRCVHTLKGTCGFLGFGQLESIAHECENLLSRIRDGAVDVTAETASLQALINDVREILQHIERHGHEGSVEQPPTAIDDVTTVASGLVDGLAIVAAEMSTRAQPIGNLWLKFPRMVRGLAAQCGKRVVVSMEGDGIALDRTALEAIKDPLMHMVRNAIDHGIELPDDRVLRNKCPEGRLVLRAIQDGGRVHVEVIDDGAGIDPVKLRANAVRTGILTDEIADRLSERDVLNLIFVAGFSTAVKVTPLSGRGVGLDVVRTNIERIGGTVEVNSIVGGGTTLRISLP